MYTTCLDSTQSQVRILILLQGESSQEIQCNLRTISLLDEPTYTALSYTWGDALDQIPIHVDDFDVLVTSNLASALVHLRNIDSDVALWVDALCINQDDADERRTQIPLMHDIYSKATTVSIWLGEEDPSTQLLADIVNYWGLPARPDPGVGNFETALENFQDRQVIVLLVFVILAMRPWWHRVWTVQECVLPRVDPIFHCGSAKLSYKAVFHIFDKLCSMIDSGEFNHMDFRSPLSLQLRSLFQSVNGTGTLNDVEVAMQSAVCLLGQRQWYQAGIELGPIDLMYFQFGRQTSLKHDYIYGLLGLLPEPQRKRMEIDYQSTYSSVCHKYFNYMLKHSGWKAVDVLVRASIGNIGSQLPSWIPDFSAHRPTYERLGGFLHTMEPFESFPTSLYRSPNEEILGLEGVRIDTIRDIYPAPQLQNSDNLVNFVITWASQIKPMASSSPPLNHSVSPELIEASKASHFSHLFLGNAILVSQSFFRTNAATAESHWDAVFSHHETNCTAEPTNPLPSSPDGTQNTPFPTTHEEYLRRIFAFPQTAAVIRTQANVLGTCFGTVQVGDEIVAFRGFRLIFILRPFERYYKLVCGVWIPGLMDWKVIKACLEDGSLSRATFVIK